MRLCDLRHVPGNTGPYLAVTPQPDAVLVLSVAPEDVVACPHCPNRHVRVLKNASAATVRELAEGLLRLACEMEKR